MQKDNKKLITIILVISAVIIVSSLCVIGVIKVVVPFFSNMIDDSDDKKAKNPFKESTDITVYDVKRQLSPIAELATYQMTYDGKEKIEDYKQLGDWNVPLTKHTIDVDYQGVIKVGFDMDDVDISVDTDEMVIYVVLPRVEVLDHYVTYESDDDNNIINSIKSDEVENYLNEEVKPRELEKAIENGIYEDAEENAKKVIKDQLSYFEKYEFDIEFSQSLTDKK
ncbi:Protein of unknown function [Lachnospiraceae bacterium XPB1003]|nr:Protein of unknown function [Lachnospiraceae bacterium XPB1003]